MTHVEPSPSPSGAERIVARLTPPGRGAICVLAVEGPGAITDVGDLFRPASGRGLETFQPRRVIFGRFGPEPGEEVILRLHGPDSLEIHCHGGQWAATRIETLLARRGWRPASWRQWLARTQPELVRRHAVEALAEAPTRQTAAILLDQLQGALHRAIARIDHALAEGHLARAQTELETLLELAPVGLHLVTPWRVVLAGPPNAGKSSLLNALAGFPRAIVHPQAGTTRDVVTLLTAIEGWPVLLCDTAGLRPPEHPLESAGVGRAYEEIAQADLVIAVFDATVPWQQQEPMLRRMPRPLVVHNKVDLVGIPRPERAPGVWTSAVTGEGLEELLGAIARRLVPRPPEPGQALPFTPHQVAALRSALEAAARHHTRGARQWLALLSGRGG